MRRSGTAPEAVPQSFRDMELVDPQEVEKFRRFAEDWNVVPDKPAQETVVSRDTLPVKKVAEE